MTRTKLLLSSCLLLISATLVNAQKVNLEREFRQWDTVKFPDHLNVDYEVFLIGDAGEPEFDPLEPNFVFLKKELDAAPENSAILYLGDNIYPAGLPTHEDPAKRTRAEKLIDAQLDLVANFKGQPYIIPGNHDWNKYSAHGLEAVKREEAYVEAKLNKGNVFLPDNGCGGPTVVELTDNLVLIVIDTEWWIHDWSVEPGINRGCDVKTRQEFADELEYVISEYDDKNIIVAGHHPIFSAGAHGGYFNLRQHIFPITDKKKKFYLPLPVLGSIYPTYRSVFGHPQDIPHPDYEKLRQVYFKATYRKKDIVYAAGHEHSLQYYEHLDNHYIVSGSGSKESFTRAGSGAKFSASDEGFSKLLYLEDGSVWAEFWVPEGDGQTGKMIFRHQLKKPVLQPGFNHPIPPSFPDSISAVGHEIYAASDLRQVMWGKHYRAAWTAEIKAPVLDLSTFNGEGLVPLKMGGGQQTRSLRMEAPDGRQYVLRSISKNVKKIVPNNFQGTVYTDIAQDQISMAHPYGAFIVPPLAEAANVYHTNPRLVYLPRQSILGDYNGVLGDEFFLFEERPQGKKYDIESFGKPDKIISYGSMVRKERKEHHHYVDQKQVLRSRIFDLWLGDWDRHDDQWRWGVFEKKDKTVFRPIPRDRDQIFLSFDGVLPRIMSSKWGLRMFQNFDYDIRDVAGLGHAARFFDRAFLTEQDLNDWEKMAEEIKENLTDEVIEDALHQWPDEIYALNGDDIVLKLKARRDRLTEFAREFYLFLNTEVTVVGTDKRERFTIERINNEQVKVTVVGLNSEGKKKKELYQRTFNRSETKEIRLFGFDGDDEFEFKGQVKSSILVRVIGGEGKDVIKDYSEVKGWCKHTVVYDDEAGGNTFHFGKETKDRTSTDPEVNSYHRKSHEYDHTMPLIILGGNVDDGFMFGGGFTKTKQGFRKKPYKSKQKVQAQYALATNAASIFYTGDFIEVAGNWDFLLNTEFKSPSFVQNYFGLGNETVNNDQTFGMDYNRLRMAQVVIEPSLKRRFANNIHQFTVGPRYEYTQVEKTDGRFVTDTAAPLPYAVFDEQLYLGIKAGYQIERVDSKVFPTRGLKLRLGALWNNSMNVVDEGYSNLNGDLTAYFSLRAPFKATLATRIGGSLNQGEYQIYQAAFLGRTTNVRGHRGQRFAGDGVAWVNTDLRIPLFNIRSKVLPGTLGIVGLYDTGRVWLEGEDSDVWHTGYGGGLWFRPLDIAVISMHYGISDDDDVFELKFGFSF